MIFVAVIHEPAFRPLRHLRRLARTFAAGALLILIAASQQSTDDKWMPRVPVQAFAAPGPVLAVDDAHREFHTLAGRFAPFGRLATADGYDVLPFSRRLGVADLARVDILVIANALPVRGGASAFSPDDVRILRDWVSGGGSLLLIADHAPFGEASAPLARAFGVEMGDGYAVVRQDGQLRANIEFRGNNLGNHPILLGNAGSRRVRSVRSFTGQSLSTPPGATALLVLPQDALEVPDERSIEELRRGEPITAAHVGGRAQCVALEFGRGRVVIAGEAAMFTVQRAYDRDIGLVSADDQAFVLNVLHWLSRRL